MAEETDFKVRVQKFLNSQNCYHVKYWGGRYTKSGVPDILVCCNGSFVGCELKASKGKPTALQLHHLRMINQSGGWGLVLYPDDFDSFQRAIDYLLDGRSIDFVRKYWKENTYHEQYLI